MVRVKPPYKGAFESPPARQFSGALKERLRQYYPDQFAPTDPEWGHPADDFVSRVLHEASWAADHLADETADITKKECRAEQLDLLKSLKGCEYKLRNLSPEVDALLGADAAPLDVADRLRELIRLVEKAGELIDKQPAVPRLSERQHRALVEMAVRVLRVLREYGIAAAATADSDLGQYSDAVKILKAIGDDMGIVRSETSWRDLITEAQKEAPDIRS